MALLLSPGNRNSENFATPHSVRADGECLDQLSRRAAAALFALADRHYDGTVIVGSDGTFIAQALVGFGFTVDWEFTYAMPMPAIYRLDLTDDQVHARARVCADRKLLCRNYFDTRRVN
ncbi:histidine phosphatase family protein [Nocardia fluminea]|uniref:histidine phosphatase family protein n=1 Tax=Nocardia fluminea TaxID=134984 RepID=UPI003446D9E7